MWFICPALSMRLIAEEKRLGTFETLLTAPVTDLQVVLSKFLGVFVFFATMVATSLPYFIFLAQGSREWDWGPVLGAFLGITLLGGLYLAIGLFASSLTKDQVVAFMIAMVLNILSFFVNAFASFTRDQSYDFLWGYLKLNPNKIANFASVHTQFQDLTLGIVSTTPLIYFLSLIAFFLFLSVRGLETQKWR
jgi:ABC-2 type transport system permease protein